MELIIILTFFMALVAVSLASYGVYYIRKDRKPRIDTKLYLTELTEKDKIKSYSLHITLRSYGLPSKIKRVGFGLAKDGVHAYAYWIPNLEEIELPLEENKDFEIPLTELKKILEGVSGFRITYFYVVDEFYQNHITNKFYKFSEKRNIKYLNDFILENKVK